MSDSPLPLLVLKDYDISDKAGFLTECSGKLPPYFASWQEIADNLPSILKHAGEIVRRVDALPLLDESKLVDGDELKTAHSILSFLVAAYIWSDSAQGNGGPRLVVPQSLAIPFNRVCKRLGFAAVPNYAAVVLYNWHNQGQTEVTLDSLRLWHRFTDLKDEEWFFVVHIYMEYISSHALTTIVRLANNAPGLQSGDEDKRQHVDMALATDLEVLRVIIGNISKAISRMYDYCAPQVFFHRIRPYLDGWNDTKKFPDGILLEEPTWHRGGSAAQSSLIQAFDKILGITHEGDGGAFLNEMLAYMPKGHRDFLHSLGKYNIRALIHNFGSAELIGAYTNCVKELATLRQTHFGLVKSYVIDEIARMAKETSIEGSKDKPSATGTGGTNLQVFLTAVIKETKDKQF